jgi:hypothetical protein
MSVGKNVEQWETLYIVGNKTKWCSHSGKENEDSSKN